MQYITESKGGGVLTPHDQDQSYFEIIP